MSRNNLLDWRWWVGMSESMVTKKPTNNYGITVLVPAYNEENSIKETILSIQAQTVHIDEIIVIDDCSDDRTGEIAVSLGVKVIKTDTNQGSKAAAIQYVLENTGIQTELLIMIDGDTRLHPNAVERTLPYFNDPQAASVCGYVIPAKINSLWERGRFIEYLFSISLFKAAQNHLGSVLVSSGCFSVFRTDLVLGMGGFNSRTMGEDMDLTWELSMKGYRVYCDQEAYCFPYDPPTGKIFVSQLDRWYRSYFQNISIHWKGLLKKDKILAAFVLGYLFDASLFLWALLWVVLYSITHLFFFSILTLWAIDNAIISVFAIIEGIRLKRLGQVLLSLPAYQITRSVNLLVFWRSMWKEWMVKDRLNVWVKGH